MSDSQTGRMFKELVAADIIVYGGGNGKDNYGFSAGVQYGETFAKCWTGVETIDSYDELKDLYNKWVSADRGWDGVVAWLAVKHGHLPLYWYVDSYKKHGKFDLSTLNLPAHPDDDWYRQHWEKVNRELSTST